VSDTETADVLGIPVAKLTLDRLLGKVREVAIAPGALPLRLAYVNAHSCNLFAALPDYRRALLEADIVYADGNGPRLAAWLAGDSLPPRMTGADWINDLCAMCEREEFGLYFLGSAPGVAEEAARRLEQRYPRLRVIGMSHGFAGPAEEAAVTAEITRLRPHIVIAAMGSPRQEIWMAETGSRLGVPVVWAAGGVLDYASGRLRRAPRFMIRLGLEWLGRALIEPYRLGGRYLFGIPRFLLRALYCAAAKRLG
jgi:N-acetylglucosaminyldiphosphoundecaprenol N-acetyl-beta-D-mannosaminyltransferase